MTDTNEDTVISRLKKLKHQYRMNKITGKGVPYSITVLILVITVIIPYAVLPWTWWSDTDFEIYTGVAMVSIFWILFPLEATPSGLVFLNPEYIPISSLFGVFNLIFALQIYRFCGAKSSEQNVIASGLLTLLIPIIFMILNHPSLVLNQTYIGPIPIQLVIGVLIMKLFETKYLETPWSES